MVTQGSIIGSGIASIGAFPSLSQTPSLSATAFVLAPAAEGLPSGSFVMAPPRNFLIQVTGDRTANVHGTVYLASGQMPPDSTDRGGGPTGAGGSGAPAGNGGDDGRRIFKEDVFVLLTPAQKARAEKAYDVISPRLQGRSKLPTTAWFHTNDLWAYDSKTLNRTPDLDGQTIGILTAFYRAGVPIAIYSEDDEEKVDQALAAYDTLYRMLARTSDNENKAYIRGKKFLEAVVRPMVEEANKVLDGLEETREFKSEGSGLFGEKRYTLDECPPVIGRDEILIADRCDFGIHPKQFSGDRIWMHKRTVGAAKCIDRLMRTFSDYALFPEWEGTRLSVVFDLLHARTATFIRGIDEDYHIKPFETILDQIDLSSSTAIYDEVVRIIDEAGGLPSFVWFDLAGTLQMPRQPDIDKHYGLHGPLGRSFPSPILPQPAIVQIMAAFHAKGVPVGIYSGSSPETVARFLENNPEIEAMIARDRDGKPMARATGRGGHEHSEKTVAPGEILIDDNTELPQRLAEAMAKGPGDESVAATQAGLWTIEARAERRELTQTEWNLLRDILSGLKK